MDTFTVRDLRERTGELISDAESGKLSLITKHGRAVIVAVPLTEQLIQWGVAVAMAISLFKEEMISLPKAAKIAGMSTEAFMEKLVNLDIPAVNYPVEDLDEELKEIG